MKSQDKKIYKKYTCKEKQTEIGTEHEFQK